MSKHILVIRHMYSADLGTLETVFQEQNMTFTKVEGFNTDISQIDPLSYDAVVILGGAMGVYQADLFPYLHDEMALIRACVAADHPLLGICLGAQLTAGALGKSVYPGTAGKEIGFMDIDLTAQGLASPLSHFNKDITHVFQWHGDTFDLPDDAVLLASSPQYRNQAFQIGRNVFGIQFHPEVDHNGLWNTLVECCNSVDVPALAADAERSLPTLETQMRHFTLALLTHWNITPFPVS
jgi:GMP synthase (glutamine-hydrolysing)